VSASSDLLFVATLIAGILAGIWFARLRTSRQTGSEAVPNLDLDRRFPQLLNALTVGVIVVDARGLITAVNPAAAIVFEFGGRSFLGRAVIEAVPSFELDRRVRSALAGNPSRGTIELRNHAQSRRLAVVTMPFDDEPGAMIVASDETRLHLLEESRREFIANLSHELRTPLSSVKLMAETLLENDADEQAYAMFLPRIRDEVDRMVQLVEDLLELARAESGRLPLRRTTSDLASLCEPIVRTFEARALLAGIDLVWVGEHVPLEVDPERLAQVVVNLIDNALRHTPTGGRVSVSVRAEGNEALLVVRDTGEGIPFNDLPRIFDRFYVVERSRARSAGGTGLGLAIVKQIVEAHGGQVSAESEFGFGATFTCAFPAKAGRPVELLR